MTDRPLLATEVLAWTLIRGSAYPGLTAEDISAARRRLSNAFQEAWIDESMRLSTAVGEAR